MPTNNQQISNSYPSSQSSSTSTHIQGRFGLNLDQVVSERLQCIYSYFAVGELSKLLGMNKTQDIAILLTIIHSRFFWRSELHLPKSVNISQREEEMPDRCLRLALYPDQLSFKHVKFLRLLCKYVRMQYYIEYKSILGEALSRLIVNYKMNIQSSSLLLITMSLHQWQTGDETFLTSTVRAEYSSMAFAIYFQQYSAEKQSDELDLLFMYVSSKVMVLDEQILSAIMNIIGLMKLSSDQEKFMRVLVTFVSQQTDSKLIHKLFEITREIRCSKLKLIASDGLLAYFVREGTVDGERYIKNFILCVEDILRNRGENFFKSYSQY